MFTTLIILFFLVVIAVYVVNVYNGLINLQNQVKQSWSDIEVMLKRRLDLIPNLVNTVKGYASHESQVFQAVTVARSALQTGLAGSNGAHQIAEADNALSQTLRSLFAVAEAYPQLQANTTFLQLQGELSSTEDKIAASRRYYNGSTRAYMTKKQQFPANIIVSFFKNFIDYEYYEADDPTINTPPTVNF